MTAWHWLSLGIVLLIFELLIGNGFLLGLAIAAGIVASSLFIFTAIPWAYQALLFGILAVISSVLWWRFFRINPTSTTEPLLNRRGEQYVGRTFTLTEPIINGRGKVRIGDSVWLVEGPDLPAGTNVRIIGCEGLLLKARSISP